MLKRVLLAIALAAVLTVGGIAASIASAPVAHAQVDSGLEGVSETIVLPDTDPRVIATRIINVSLGLIGIILVVIIVYAGFLYMTSGGDAAKTQKALLYIRNAIIGLIIILMAWGITRFVIEGILSATNQGGGGGVGTSGPGGSGGGGGGGGFGGSGSQPFAVVSITPSGEVGTRKVIVKIVFNRSVSEESATQGGTILVENGSGVAVPGDVSVSGRVVQFTPATPCPAPNQDRRCFDENTDYTVRVSNSLESTGGDRIACGGFSTSCEGTFRTGTETDITPPLVSVTYPVSGQGVPADTLVDVSAYVEDQTGVSYVSFAASGGSGASVIGEAAPAPGTRSPTQFDARTLWDTAGLAPGSQYALSATAYDVDSGVATSESVTVTIRAAGCFNGVQDGNETGLDCGGNPGASDYCGVCSGDACTAASQCTSGVCSAGQCVDQPIITSMTPQDGAVGSFVTLRGVNFGQNGQVTFLGASGSQGVVASAPVACTAAGVDTWGPSQAVVQVPPGAQSGAIQLTNAASGLSDATNAPPNPFINDFLVNDTQRPGICAVVPTEGEPGDRFEVLGSGFGSTAATILFGDRTLSSTGWSDSAVSAVTPNVTPGGYALAIQVADRVSNPVQFDVTSRDTASGPPEIAEINPPQGPVGTYVTLAGRDFGRTIGQVIFRDLATGNEALADTSFPPVCSEEFWSDDVVVVKVPRAFTRGGTGSLEPGAYAVRVVAAVAGGSASNEVNFAVNTDALAPGICAITPAVAPVGSTVTLHGEGFTQGPGAVTFYQGRDGTVETWSRTSVTAAIPTGARPGPVTLTPTGGSASNGIMLDVRSCTQSPDICKNGDVCCADGTCRAAGSCEAAASSAMFAWRMSTGLIPRAPRVVEECAEGAIPSPSPWLGRSGGDEACVNATVAIRFTTQIDPASMTPGSDSIQIFACTGSGSDPCDERAPVRLALGYPALFPANATQDYVELSPLDPFAPDTLHEVVVTTDVRGAGEAGIQMTEDAGRCGAGNAYCFRFRTKNDISSCNIGTVRITPDPFTATEQGPLPREHRASAVSVNDSCTLLACEAFDWTWSTSDSRASVTNERESGQGACRQTVTARAETGDDPVMIQAETLSVQGAADLYVKFIPPVIERYGPHCDTACTNALVWAVANVELDEATVTPENILIQKCNNENCLSPEEPGFNPTAEQIRVVSANGTSDSRLRQISVVPLEGGVSFLEEGAFYKVTLKGGTETGIHSLSGVPLTGLNSPQGFSWVFRVAQGEDAVCRIERMSVTPQQKFATAVGARQAFVATPYAGPDACSESGQQLVPDNMSWASSDTNVATLLFNGALDTGPLPAGCSGICTLLGANGRSGQIARCGNGIIETTNPLYCDGGVTRPGGQACTLLPVGGRGGEECDDGNDINEDACNNACLWNPVPSVSAGGTCGNGVVNLGEDCDFGRVCQGALAEGSPLSPGDDCTSAQAAAQCAADGGLCATVAVRGCSPTCRYLGSQAGGSTCGNGDLGEGEDCDDGNRANGDGCSAACLHEGSTREIYASCGNGQLEPGEACEITASGWPAGCNTSTCLNIGTQPCTESGQALCCGNGTRDPGEDCDDGSDGCSPICLLKGSSAGYATPSFCGDGVIGIGEQCEAPVGGDGFVDPVQVAEIVGDGVVDEATGRQSALISATLNAAGVSGEAVYGLQCGFTQEASCLPLPDESDPNRQVLRGLTRQGCCSARPTLVDAYPLQGAQDVCRNVRISGRFNVEMDTSSLQANFLVAKRVADTACPNGLRDVTFNTEATPGGIRGFFVRMWQRVLALFQPNAVLAQRWCAGTVAGSLESEETGAGTVFFFTLNTPLEPFTEYRVRFIGDTSNVGREDEFPHPFDDNSDVNMRTGVKSKQGVVALPDEGDSGALTWTFTTGQELCRVNQVIVKDTNTQTPNFFTATNEAHIYTASAVSLKNGAPVFVSPIEGVYDWEWENWVFSRPAMIDIQPNNFQNDDERTAGVTTRSLVAKNVSGTGVVSARVKITTDTLNDPPTTDQVVQGTESVTVNVCENPWPARAKAPFRDERGSPSLQGTPFQNGPFFNFSMGYCRDAGVTGPNEDLPGLEVSFSNVNASDDVQGILRQYFFTFREPELQKDGIGIRIAKNDSHLSPLDWYRAQGFSGNPQAIQVDGYEAIREGRTVYISAASTEGPTAGGASTDMYSNIYIVSYNDGAEPITRQVYDALLDSMSFNTNVQYDVANACQVSSGSLIAGNDGLPVTCEADHECARFGVGVRCASFKGKVQRDLVRLADFQSLTTALSSARNTQGTYPTLRTGSYLPGVTTSRWPSWNDTFRAALGQGGSTNLATDPVNRFATCGRCSGSETACVADTDCAQGSVCVAQAGFDPATCWNAQAEQFLCPSEPDINEQSRVYQYRSLAGGTQFELAADFEIPPPSANINSNWWKPAPAELLGNGARYRYTDVCRGEIASPTGICGDGVLNDGEACELTGPTATRAVACTTGDGAQGEQQYRCLDCLSYGIDTSAPGCFANVQCGNGRIDSGEVCDDGAQNGSYGRCSTTCDGYAGFCGDGQRSVGEVCDNGTANTDYCASGSCTLESACNLTCSGKPAYCGNGRVDAGEQCDGPVTSREGCPAGEVKTRSCSASCQLGSWGACEPEGTCGDGRVNPGEACDDGNTVNEDACTNSCERNSCGDGFVWDGVEECDMGAQNGQSCSTAEYGGTCASCSTSCKFQLTQGGYCGDGIRTASSGEQCDGTDLGRPVPSCQALGFDYLDPNITTLQCTDACQVTGCVYCGSSPGTGSVEGYIFDTLFQQPVPGARVSLYYRGLLVDQQAADTEGYFRFGSLDNNPACSQYRLVVDSYADNPLTPNFNEQLRGGYQPVEIPAFQPSNNSLLQAVLSAKKGVGTPGKNCGPNPCTVLPDIARINLLPQLADSEYVVQLWWEPRGGYSGMQREFQDFIQANGAGAADSFYGQRSLEDEYHDLVIRVPFTYAPGGGSCQLSPTPQVYQGNGRNTTELAEDGTLENPDEPPGTIGVDRAHSDTGMVSCTNKIRATASYTCSGANVPANLRGRLPCAPNTSGEDPTCRDRYGITGSDAKRCDGPAEASRAGNMSVLSGSTGAYLFCYHPEWHGIDESRTASVDCTNFILPPQSAFIHAQGGQYDILVSQYRLFAHGGSHSPPRSEGERYTNAYAIREWLWKRKAEIHIYDKSGLSETIAFRDVDQGASGSARTGGWWAEWDSGWACLTSDTVNQLEDNVPALKNATEMLDTITYSPVWTPASIDTTSQRVNMWNPGAPGYAGADYRYFADLLHNTHRAYASHDNPSQCREETCKDPNNPNDPFGLINCGGTLTETDR